MQILNPYQSNYITARSADNDLDIMTIINGCNQVLERINNLDYGIRNINMAKSYFDEKNFSIDNKGIVWDEMDNYADSLGSIKQYISDVIEEIKTNAIARYNETQEFYNNDAIRQEEQMRNS